MPLRQEEREMLDRLDEDELDGAALAERRVTPDEIHDALVGMIGLVMLICARDDITHEIKDAMLTNHRYLEARAVAKAPVQTGAVGSVPGWKLPSTLPEKKEGERFDVYLAFDTGEVKLASWMAYTEMGSEYHGTTGVYLGEYAQGGDALYMTDDGFDVRREEDGEWRSYKHISDTERVPFRVTAWMEALLPLPKPPCATCADAGMIGVWDEMCPDCTPQALAASPSPPALQGVVGGELADAARFLIDRLHELEWNDLDVTFRDFCGHVEPAIGRVQTALAELTRSPQTVGGGE
jgi:hypothetical protein